MKLRGLCVEVNWLYLRKHKSHLQLKMLALQNLMCDASNSKYSPTSIIWTSWQANINQVVQSQEHIKGKFLLSLFVAFKYIYK